MMGKPPLTASRYALKTAISDVGRDRIRISRVERTTRRIPKKVVSLRLFSSIFVGGSGKIIVLLLRWHAAGGSYCDDYV